MAIYKVVDAEKLDANLKSVADKIREKSGTTDDLAFPQGFKDAVDAISASSGGGEVVSSCKLPQVVDRTVTEITEEDLRGAKVIKDYSFQNCTSLASVTIPDSVTSIDWYVFYGCTSLTSVTIGNSVTSIGAYAFYNCTSMKYYDFTKHESVPTLSNKNAFASIPATCEIRVPLSLVDEWKAATNWSTYANQIVGV